MDHLPRVADPAVEPIVFPYHGGSYECLHFDDYPASQGLEADDILLGLAPDAKAHLQTWFYFGLLSEVLALVEQADFLSAQPEGEQVLTTWRLEHYVTQWWSRVKSQPMEDKRAIFDNARRCNQFVMERMYLLGKYPRVREIIGEEFSLAIHILGATLSHVVAKYAAFRRLAWRQDMPVLEMRVNWPATNTYIDRMMLESGWCRNEVARFENMLSPLTQIFALGFKRVGRLRHDACTELDCVANNVDSATYKTAHVDDDCSCDFVHVDVAAVTSILNKKTAGIPLVELREKPDSTIELKVTSYNPLKRYVAVSHVWSDGMGNNDHNSLPQCQLKRLHRLGGELLTDPTHIALPHEDAEPLNTIQKGIARIYHQTPLVFGIDHGVTSLWIDTLCIPLQEEPRKVAIRGMADVYKKAHRVMIIDSELLPVEHNTPEESMLRITMSSGWMRRLWTLQEGIFANQRAYVYFQNKAIRPSQIVERLMVEDERGSLPLFNESIVNDAYGHWLALFGMSQAYASRIERFMNSSDTMNLPYLTGRFWEAITRRSTSKDSDRPVVMASLLGLDTSQVLQIPSKASSTNTVDGVRGGPAERMKKLYELMSEFPQGIIFQKGERFTEDGWRWAVKSCKSDASTGEFQIRIGSDPGRIHLPFGLLVDFPGIVMLRGEIDGEPSYAETQGLVPVLALVNCNTEQSMFLDTRDVDFDSVLSRSTYGIGLILDTSKPTSSWDQMFPYAKSLIRTLLMVSIYRNDKGILYTRREGTVVIWRERRVRDSLYGSCRNALVVDNKQKWWVG